MSLLHLQLPAMPCCHLPTPAPLLPTLPKLLGVFCSSAQILDWEEFGNRSSQPHPHSGFPSGADPTAAPEEP